MKIASFIIILSILLLSCSGTKYKTKYKIKETWEKVSCKENFANCKWDSVWIWKLDTIEIKENNND